VREQGVSEREVSERARAGGTPNCFGGACALIAFAGIRHVGIRSAGCDSHFPGPRGRVGMQGRKDSSPPNASST
jgi:hypothetical protein